MKERPILFSGPMVRAILEPRKSQTRRVLKPQPLDTTSNGTPYTGYQVTTLSVSRGFDLTAYCDNPLYIGECPYGVPGDRLWVRETWGVLTAIRHAERKRNIVYRADCPATEPPLNHGVLTKERIDWLCLRDQPWKPSIHMPRWASRLTLEISAVRVERVQDISEQDAIAEGVTALDGNFEGCFAVMGTKAMSGTTARECFSRLWDSINASRGYGWDANPWVWVVEFRRIA